MQKTVCKSINKQRFNYTEIFEEKKIERWNLPNEDVERKINYDTMTLSKNISHA